MARHSAGTFCSLHYTAECFKVMYLNQQCSWCSQSEKQYSHSQSKEKTLCTGNFSTIFFFFSTVFHTSVGSILPPLCSIHVFQYCQATEGSLKIQPRTQKSKLKTIRPKRNNKAKPTNQPYSQNLLWGLFIIGWLTKVKTKTITRVKINTVSFVPTELYIYLSFIYGAGACWCSR